MEQFKASYSRSSRGQLLQTITGWRKTDKDRPIHGLTSTSLWSLGFIPVAQQVNNISVPVSDAATAVQRTNVFIEEMNSWLSASRLRLNPAKTEVMWLRSGQQINHVDDSDILILSSSVKVVESARDLGVNIDSQLSLLSHVAAPCRSEFYHLRQLRPLCRSLPAEATKTLVYRRSFHVAWTTATLCCTE